MSELKRINCSCSVGIATGTVFAGVVGTSGSRREFSVLGDSVNLAARLMQAACQETNKKVLIDEKTARSAMQKLSIRFFKSMQVKGKAIAVNVYEAIDSN